MRKTLVIVSLICLTSASGYANRSDPGIPDLIRTEVEELALHSDIVIRGRVIKMSRNLNNTLVKISVEHVFHGDLEGSVIDVYVNSGKVRVDTSEPSFFSPDRSFLFLYKEGEVYRVVNGAEGKKTIVHKNVYLDPNNHFSTAKLLDYETILSEIFNPVSH